MRTLYIVQMVHSLCDMRRYPEDLRDSAIEAGAQKLKKGLTINGRHISGDARNPWNVVMRFWKLAEEAINTPDLITFDDTHPLHVYCESLFCDSATIAPLKQIRRGIEENNPLFILLNKLHQAGARIRGTESEGLLNEVERRIQAAFLSDNLIPVLASAIRKRDIAIANRIHSDLPANTKALLFMGNQHNVARSLAWRRPRIHIEGLVTVSSG